MATSKARPVPASQAEKANSSMGEAEKLIESSCKVQTDSAMKRDSIIASKHKSAERRWVR